MTSGNPSAVRPLIVTEMWVQVHLRGQEIQPLLLHLKTIRVTRVRTVSIVIATKPIKRDHQLQTKGFQSLYHLRSEQGAVTWPQTPSRSMPPFSGQRALERRCVIPR